MNNKNKAQYVSRALFFILASVFLFFVAQGNFSGAVRAQDLTPQNSIGTSEPEGYDVEILGLEGESGAQISANEIPADDMPSDEILTNEVPEPEPSEEADILEPLEQLEVKEEPLELLPEPLVDEEPQIKPEEVQLVPPEEILTEQPAEQALEATPEEPTSVTQTTAPASQEAKPTEKVEEKTLPEIKVSLDFKEADIRNVLRILSYKSGVNIVASPEVAGVVTIRLTDVPWDKALDVILNTYGYGYERRENIISVYPMEILTAKKREQAALAEVQPTVTKVIKLKFIDAIDMKKTLDPQLSARGKVTVLEMTGQAGWAFGGAELGKRQRLSERQGRSKMLIISDVPPVLEKLEKVITELDVRPEQVLIETRILEVNRDKLKDLGLELGTGADGNSFVEASSKESGTPPGPETQVKLKSQTLQVAPSTFGPKVSLGGTVATFAGGLTAYFQKVTGTQFQAILHALEEDVETNTLSAPRILTLSNQEATILVGSKYPILTSEVSSESAQTVTTTLDYYQDIGIQLNVVPQVNDDGYINLIVHPAVTSYTTTVGTNLYPVIDTRETETQVLIKDGETVVIGGLLKDVKGISKVGVPFLSHIPILGFLFNRDVVDTQKIDLIIFITARVVKPDEDLITLIANPESPVRTLLPAQLEAEKPPILKQTAPEKQ